MKTEVDESLLSTCHIVFIYYQIYLHKILKESSNLFQIKKKIKAKKFNLYIFFAYLYIYIFLFV